VSDTATSARQQDIDLVKAYWWGLPLMFAINSIAFALLWNWYVPHLIGSAHHIGIATAFGAVLLIKVFETINPKRTAPPLALAARGLTLNIGRIALVVLAGYIVHAVWL